MVVRISNLLSIVLFALAANLVSHAASSVKAPDNTNSTNADVSISNLSSNLGVFKGVVRDNAGGPIANATVAFFRIGTTKVLKQVSSNSNGLFLAKILPGTYSVLAVAEGYNPVSIASLEVARSAQIDHGFKLERAGSGNTLPEKRRDRNNPKWNIRAAQISRSIYQNSEGPQQETVAERPEDPAEKAKPGKTIVETYFADTASGTVSGLNVATSFAVGNSTEMVIAAQTGIGAFAPQRIETQIIHRPSLDHQIRVAAGFGKIGHIVDGLDEKTLSQFSLQATDEWKVREGIILVYGLDLAKFAGAGNDLSISPRIGFQVDVDSKTRFRTAYASHTENRTWTSAIELENAQIRFVDPAEIQDVVVSSGQPVQHRSSRLEFGVERILDNRSSIEANVFFDTTFNRGLGVTLAGVGANSLAAGDFEEFTLAQNGNARGIRVVYSRKLTDRLSTSAGYSFGEGQKLSEERISEPAKIFQNDIFSTFFGQFEADLFSGTNVKTVLRLSPEATVFAIDPFQGRLAIYDPSLSIYLTQSLPTLGLPIRAEAVVDARNLFGFRTGIATEDATLRLNNSRRSLRGGILVRF